MHLTALPTEGRRGEGRAGKGREGQEPEARLLLMIGYDDDEGLGGEEMGDEGMEIGNVGIGIQGVFKA